MEELNYEQRLVKLGLPSLQYRRTRADMIQVYKIVTGLDRINPRLFFDFAHDSKSCYNPLRLGTVIVLVSSGIDFVNTPRLYSDRAAR